MAKHSADAPGGPAIGMPLAWRCAVIALIPVLLWAFDRAVYDYVPDAADGRAYEVRVNRITGARCLRFGGGPPPERLRPLAC